MEKNNNKRDEGKPQKFYFNDQGKLIVESNKGVWADGEQFVKMYGIFTCNANTMGEIIHKMEGIPVEIGAEEIIRLSKNEIVDELLHVNQHTIQHYCILGASKERIKEYEESLATVRWETRKTHELEKQVEEIKKDAENFAKMHNDASDKLYSLRKEVEKFNRLPWWKRLFKKVNLE